MQERSHIIAIPALSPRFGQLKIDPQSAFAKGSANPQHAAEDAAEPFIGALRLLDMMEVDILVKPSENPVGDSFVLTHQNKPVLDLRPSIMYFPGQINALLLNAVSRAVDYVGRTPRPDTLGIVLPLKTEVSDLVTIGE